MINPVDLFMKTRASAVGGARLSFKIFPQISAKTNEREMKGERLIIWPLSHNFCGSRENSKYRNEQRNDDDKWNVIIDRDQPRR